MKRFGFFIAVVAIVAAFLFWWFSPTQVVKRRTETLLETLTMESTTSKLTRQTGVYSLNALLSQEVELITPTISAANGEFERQELESAYSWLADHALKMRFELLDIRSITVAGETAQVVFSLEALVELPSSRPADGRYEVVFSWMKDDRTWRLSKAEWNEKP